MEEAFEQFGALRWLLKGLLTDPIANYFPAGWLRGLLRFGKSELAAANWADPGGWRSMVISYEGNPRQWADRILVGAGAVSVALRNRLRLASSLLTEQINNSAPPVHVLCLGAGPGQAILRAMRQATVASCATLVDLNADAFAFGRNLAAHLGLLDRVSFVQGDVRDIARHLAVPPGIVKMVGICEHLTDEQVVSIATAAAEVMPAGAPIVFNNITRRHGNDRFLRRVFGVHMTYRSAVELMALMQSAGFGDFRVHAEPLGVYNVMVGYRGAAAKRASGVG